MQQRLAFFDSLSKKTNIQVDYVSLSIPLIIILISLSYSISTQINWDVLHVLNFSESWLKGGSYLQNLFDNNPPMIFMISTLPIVIAQHTGMSSAVVYIGLTYITASISLITCWWIINRTYHDKSIERSILLLLSICFFIIPGTGFGQREHLTIIFTFPYFFLLASRVNHQQWSSLFCLLVGLFCGLGISLKPFFILSIGFTELYLMYHKRRFFTFLRIEVYAIIAVHLVYLFLIIKLTPTFIPVMMPVILNFYFNYFQKPLSILLMKKSSIFFMITLITSLFLKQNTYKALNRIFLFAAIGFFLCFIIQKKGWLYHSIPFASATLIATAPLYIDWWKKLFYRHAMKYAFLLSCLSTLSLWATASISLHYWERARKCIQQNCPYHQLVHSPEKYGLKDQNIFFFASAVQVSAPLIYYSGNHAGSRTTNLWFMPSWFAKNTREQQQLKPMKHWLEQLIIEDFKRYNPKAVYVVEPRRSSDKLIKEWDYLSFMKNNPEFKAIWKQYHYVETFDAYDVYVEKKFSLYLKTDT